MTRTKVASGRPQTAGTTPTGRGSSRALRKLVVLPVVMLLAIAPVAPALAVQPSGASNYGQSPTAPKEKAKPATGTAPSKSKSMPSKESAPSSGSAPAKESSTLPRTGLDLRWTVGAGLLLVGAGFSIVMVQRRQRRDSAL